ncbi:MAG TPA: hypothetical protein DCR23_06130, partial [Ruminococcaceae bacterium]|nr:hypothetical protein [Oscillospiraceae bacterium]
MNDLNEQLNELLGEGEKSEAQELERLSEEYFDAENAPLPEAQLSDDVYNDIIKNTENSVVF